MKTYSVSQKKLSLVEISCGKYNSGWWEIHVEFLTNPCEAVNLAVEKSLDSVCLHFVVDYFVFPSE